MSNNRNTIQRQLVIDAVRCLNHPTADEVHDYISANHPTVSRATVYRNLNLLADKKEILKIATPDSAYHYDMTPTQHFHAQCNMCAAVFDLEISSSYIEALKSKVTESYGFRVDGQEIMFKGVCQNCQSSKN